MRIATWNVNGMNARQEYVPHWLRAVAPDVVGLQELKMVDEQFPHAAFEPLGYRALTHGQKSWNGVGVLSKLPADVRHVGLEGQAEMGARLLAVDVGGISFVTVYVPNGKHIGHEDYGKKLAWLDALAAFLAARYRPTDPLVVCGDFNVCPAPIDSWNEKLLSGRIFHTDQERARIRALAEWGLCDLYRQHLPDDPGHTWWDYRAGAFHKRQGLRIDLVLGTEPVARRVTGVGLSRDWRKKVEGLTPSDHAPVWIDLAD